MNIALVAPNEKRELLTQFCIAYKKTLSKHSILATANIADYIKEETGLESKHLQAINNGGALQIASRVEYNEIDLVFYFRNTNQRKEQKRVGMFSNDFSDNADSDLIIEKCDKNNIPVATNIATAEILVMGLERGDLDWREYLRNDKN